MITANTRITSKRHVGVTPITSLATIGRRQAIKAATRDHGLALMLIGVGRKYGAGAAQRALALHTARSSSMELPERATPVFQQAPRAAETKGVHVFSNTDAISAIHRKLERGPDVDWRNEYFAKECLRHALNGSSIRVLWNLFLMDKAARSVFLKACEDARIPLW